MFSDHLILHTHFSTAHIVSIMTSSTLILPVYYTFSHNQLKKKNNLKRKRNDIITIHVCHRLI